MVGGFKYCLKFIFMGKMVQFKIHTFSDGLKPPACNFWAVILSLMLKLTRPTANL